MRQSGSDSNNGKSAATAWRTIGKALGASGISSGDTVFIGAGTFRETVTCGLTNPTATTSIIGDVDGSQTGDAGEVIWSAYTAGDFAAPSGSPCVNLNNNNYLTFENLTFIGGNNQTTSGHCVANNANALVTNLTLRNCTLFATRTGSAGNGGLLNLWSTGSAINLTVDGCRFFAGHLYAINITAITQTTGADYNLNATVRNSTFFSTLAAVQVTYSGSSTYKGNGLSMQNCGGMVGNVVVIPATFVSTTYPTTVTNCQFVTTAAALNAGTSGQITDGGGNRFYNYTSSTVTNVTQHATTRFGTFPNIFPLELGQSAVLGLPYRHPLMPYATSGTYPGGALGFGNVSGGTTTSITGRARPSGSGVIMHTGTATAATTSTLSDSGKTFGTSTLIGKLIRITGGTGSGQVKRISANTATQVTISGAAPAGGLWATTPSTDSTYIIYDGPQVETGKATAGAATTLTDSGANWATNQWAGYSLELTGGTGSGQTATITSNTATVITVPTWTTNPDNTTTYSLYWPGTSLTATQSSAGAFELGDTAKAVSGETGTAIQIDGPGAQDVTVPVTAAATTITVRALFDSNHGTTTKPQIQVLAQPEIGVSLTTATATGAADTWETLTLSFTPTAAGAVTLRFVSRSATPYGYACFDTVTVS